MKTVLDEMHAEAEWAERALEELETWEVENKARKWKLTIDPSLYDENVAGHMLLEKDGRAKVLKMVRDARRVRK